MQTHATHGKENALSRTWLLLHPSASLLQSDAHTFLTPSFHKSLLILSDRLFSDPTIQDNYQDNLPKV